MHIIFRPPLYTYRMEKKISRYISPILSAFLSTYIPTKTLINNTHTHTHTSIAIIKFPSLSCARAAASSSSLRGRESRINTPLSAIPTYHHHPVYTVRENSARMPPIANAARAERISIPPSLSLSSPHISVFCTHMRKARREKAKI